MKLILIVAACIGLSFAAPKVDRVTPRSLIDDITDFINLLPVDDIKAIAEKHLQDDGAFAAVIVYLQGDDWKSLVDTVLAKPRAQELIDYLNDAGVPVDDIIAAIRSLIDGAVPGVEPDESGSLRPLLDEIEAILPVADLVALLNNKLQNSPDFQNLYVEVSSEDTHALVEEVRAMAQVQELAQKLRDMGVKVDEVLAIVYEFLGWGEPKVSPRSLIDDITDFINLLPVDDIKAIAEKHLQDDGAFAVVIEDLQDDKWKSLVQTVLEKPRAKELIDYLNDAGVPVDNIVTPIIAWIDGAVPGVEPDESESLRPLLDEIEAILPVTDLVALLNDKLQNSPYFQDLYLQVSSEDTHALVEEVRAMAQVQDIAQKLRDKDVKVDEVLAIVYEFLGWGEPKVSPRSLIDDITDFINLLPVDDIKAIAEKHLEDDGAFAYVIAYLQGDEWKSLVDTVLAKSRAQELIVYLNDAGVPVDDILAAIRALIDGAVLAVEPDEKGSLRPLLDEIEAILPVADLVALLNDKLQNSPDFQELYVQVSSEDTHALVEEVRALDTVQKIAQQLRDMGVKVDEALAVVYEFLGWGTPKKI